MNVKSNGSLPRRADTIGWALAAALGAGFAATVAGCPGPAPQAGNGGSGGEGASSSSSSSSTTTSSSSTTTSSSTSTSSSTGGMPCASPSDCPAAKPCEEAVCVAGVCGVHAAPVSTPCSDNGGKVCDGAGKCVSCALDDDCPTVSTGCLVPVCSNGTCDTKPAASATPCMDNGGKLCDDSGQCVECLKPDDCPPSTVNVCVGTQYTPPPACTAGKCVFNDPEDCAKTHQVCKPLSGCSACASAVECPPVPQGSCKVPLCNLNAGGTCELGNAVLGTPCMGPNGPGECNDTGVCFDGRFVFVTAAAVGSSFGGAAIADNKCQGIANGKGWTNTIWKSWTSDAMTQPPQLRFGKSGGPYRLLDGTLVAGSFALLTSAPLNHGIDMDENHFTSPIASLIPVWTGTTVDGSYSTLSCNNWTGAAGTTGGTAGIVGATDHSWTDAGPKPCDGGGMARIYCFQQ